MATIELTAGPAPTLERVPGSDRQAILRLASPGVFVDQFGRPAPVPDTAELEDLLQAEVRLTNPWSDPRWDVHGGWHAASGLPKPEERVVAAGTTYLVRTAQPLTDTALQTLAMQGLGLRRHEGYGALATTRSCGAAV
ncbi:type III-B CRISPR module-associated Cmr3 family protein [Ornithinimicrobium kibberense]|uniref:Type III-B CRISPR module-associated Cmr3 family protein n=1 Tax=Ornithinimicrobium kibberense TaxID=282060 RepID=A0ABV5V6I8_9MICO